ncbi:PREDICTED: LETM1 and EF-hand domain-containing protein anon-60Da, mitochondrial-like [Diuraphis noxia]|uniref:LETM1 and EF-hand domain-containing protein anon-60Da, mitochondrial-like n=1 Tax=Diuraphis noxia TaxID=143948 RepID=UPI000763A199|nr:PREDICTED: LETM1 and EF-hand domain-containing protein anon-60Da, mitochondrial-like [Diuraphis noxia]
MNLTRVVKLVARLNRNLYAYNINKTKTICLSSHLSTFSSNYFYSNISSNQFLPISYRTNHLNSKIRQISYTSSLLSKNQCSKIKEAVNADKIKCKNKEANIKKLKKSLKQRIIDELYHFYYGFKLLGLNTKISFYLAIKKLRGIELTRREHKLFVQTIADLLRLIPFSVFILVPFMELTLPFFIKFFPGMLPTTFQTKDQKEIKLIQSLKVKLEMAKFLQKTLDNMSVCGKEHTSELAQEFADFFSKVRKEGIVIPAHEMLKFSKLFKDEITLDSLPRPQLVALCRVLELQSFGTSSVLKYLLTLKLRSLLVDDKMIQKEGVDSLTLSELQEACKSRGMGAYGLTENRLKQQLTQWLDLSLNERVPPLLLLLSRAFSLTSNIPTNDLLKNTICSLPYGVGASTEADLCERDGAINNKVKLEATEKEERKAKEEIEEEEHKAKGEIEECMGKNILLQLDDTLKKTSNHTCNKVDVLKDATGIEGELSSTDLKTLECAIENMCSNQSKLLLEISEICELKNELKCYQNDRHDLQEIMGSVEEEQVRESEPAKQLYNALIKIINDIDQVVNELEKKELVSANITTDGKLIKIDELIAVVRKLQNVPDECKIQKIVKILSKIDNDKDGSIRLDILLKMLRLMNKVNMNLSDETMNIIMQIVIKEQNIGKSGT